MTHFSPLLYLGGVILVTGGTGFTGSHLVSSLFRDYGRVRVLTRSAARASMVLPQGVEIIEGDITDPDAVDRATADCEVVYNLAAAFREPGITEARYAQVHVEGTRHLLETADLRGSGLRLPAMWFLSPFYSRPSAWRHPLPAPPAEKVLGQHRCRIGPGQRGVAADLGCRVASARSSA